MASYQNLVVLLVFLSCGSVCLGQVAELKKIFEQCHKKSPDFDECMKGAFNQVTVFYKTGIPELKIAPFDPHRAAYIEQRRGMSDGIGGYRLVLTDVTEYEWSNSIITKFKSEPENNRFIYTQDFPQKHLDGHYDMKASMFGTNIHSKGHFNISLFDYTQTTSVTRVGGPGSLLKVRIEIDKVRDMQVKITNNLNGSQNNDSMAEFFVNNFWQPGFPFFKPLVNDLISSAFTDIYNEAFRYLDIDQFIKD